MKKNNLISILMGLMILSSCSLSPGMYFKKDFTKNNTEYVYLDNTKEQSIAVEELNLQYLRNNFPEKKKQAYKLGVGDGIVVTVWGLPEIFPMNISNNGQNVRTISAEGNIFFPYVGEIYVVGMTQSELRLSLTRGLSNYFNDPQLDVSVASYNSQKIYILGEVTNPKKLFLTETPLTLADALGESLGLKTETSEAKEVFIIRSNLNNDLPQVFKADMSSPSGFLVAGEFQLEQQDVIYVNAKGTSRWNRVISQFFPFSSLLNSVDNLVTD